MRCRAPRRAYRRAAAWLAAGLLTLQALCGCGTLGPGSGPDVPDGDRKAVRALLDRWSAALRDRDERAFLAAVDPAAEGYRAEQRRVFANLAAVPLATWEYRLVRTGGFAPAQGDGRRLAAETELRYRLAGYDAAPVVTKARLTVVERDGRWYVTAEDAPRGRQLWQQGPVTAVRGERSLVLGVGQDRARLEALAAAADRAVPAVAAAWRDGGPGEGDEDGGDGGDGKSGKGRGGKGGKAGPGAWPGRVVVQMPASVERMAALLDSPVSNYRGIAAVTTGEVGGSGEAPADRIIVNPEAYGALGSFGRQVVLTHETAHVATRALTSAATPLWLSEGFADWTAYRGTGRTARQAAPELARAVAAGKAPRGLPTDADFGFAGESGRLARAYEEGWLACRMIAERWGEEKLVAFYRGVGGRERRSGAVGAELRRVLGISQVEFTAEWRAYVERELG
ncbi:hypothetical protein [Streptomyces albireticuli]|nr:hypothetical protein [Streptomyces albireticuli]MCD9142104.1 hypothetical protein [Streptomyces albireticuli]MCD9162642.1 hypothetical protein [Streptomyces albireticuli]MCD9190278.1 hypothetical protein [Streptomyces albireticuli]